MQKNRNGQADQQKAVAEERAQSILIHRLFDHLRDKQQGKIHPLVVDPLPGDEIDQQEHDRIAEQDEELPRPSNGASQAVPGNVRPAPAASSCDRPPARPV